MPWRIVLKPNHPTGSYGRDGLTFEAGTPQYVEELSERLEQERDLKASDGTPGSPLVFTEIDSIEKAQAFDTEAIAAHQGVVGQTATTYEAPSDKPKAKAKAKAARK